MKLQKLQLENFRNYETYTYNFSQNKNFIVLTGENGRGKTNLLEAIYTLSLGRSFRTITKDNLIKWDKNYLRIKGETQDGENEKTFLEVFYARTPARKRNFKKNEVNLKNSEYIGNLLTVLFHPEDLNMLYLSPSYRRRYMDILLSQTDKKYLFALSKYKKVLKHRSSLLHQIKEARQKTELENNLDSWDVQLVDFGAEIILKRKKLIEFLNKNLEEIYRSISGNKENVETSYRGSVKDISSYKEELKNLRERDIRTEKTNIGPHLDDIEFFIDDKNILTSASRGEFRTLLLAIKLAEIEFIKLKTKENPVLLLDDVFSELDHLRRNHLIKSIKNCQTIITTTDTQSLKELQEKNISMEFVNLSEI